MSRSIQVGDYVLLQTDNVRAYFRITSISPRSFGIVDDDNPSNKGTIDYNLATRKTSIRGLSAPHTINFITKEQYDTIHPSAKKLHSCSDDVDIFSYEEWEQDYLPEITIDFIDANDPKKPPYVACFRKDDITQWKQDDENYFAKWEQISQYREMDESGRGGKPSDRYIFLKLPGNQYIENIPNPPVGDFVAIPVAKNVRVGNTKGIFGISMLHGQIPGETIYRVLPKNQYSSLLLNLYYLKGLGIPTIVVP